MDQAEASGKTVDDALRSALNRLGANREEVEIVILDEGKRGFLGRGGRDAMVRVERIAGSSPSAAPQQRQPDTRIPRGGQRAPRDGGRAEPSHGGNDRHGGQRERGNRSGGTGGRTSTRTGFDAAAPKLTDADFLRAPGDGGPASAAPSNDSPGSDRGTPRNGGSQNRGGRRDEPRPDRPDRPERPRGERRHREDEPAIAPDINAEEVDFAAQTVDDVLRILGIDAELSIREPLTAGDGLGAVLAVIDIMGEDLGVLIGRRGDTLLSLQYLVNLILARRHPGKGGVTIDVEHYRHRREEQVVSLAQRMAERVRETGSPITLEPMSAAERRLVHLLFAEDPALETNSIGEGENRKVVISARR